MLFGLKADIIQKINKVFAGYPEISKVVVYGSRAKGNYKPGSDIDLTIFGENLTSFAFNKLTNELDDLMLPYTIDLSLYDQITNDKLRAHINRVGKEFYPKPAA